jgi:RNA polymerase sigma-70 factor (ECF subfamily)
MAPDHAPVSGEVATRRSFIERLRNRDDKESWREFFNRYWKLIYGLAIKAGLTKDEAEEAVQETMATLARNLDQYEYRPHECTFKSWIFKAAEWRIIDQIRKRPPEFVKSCHAHARADETATVERVPDKASRSLEQLWDEEWHSNLMGVALDRVRQKAHVKDYQIFDLYLLQAQPVAEVKKLLRASAAYVYVAKHRVAALIQKEMKKLAGELE